MEEEKEQLTPEELQVLDEAMKSYGSPIPEEKHNVHTFLHKVATAIDTTKLGNLTAEEIGFTPYSLRTYKQLELMSDVLCNDPIWKSYYHEKGEILTATSLSKEGKLISLAVLQKREIADVTPKTMKQNRGWFTKKDKNENSGGTEQNG